MLLSHFVCLTIQWYIGCLMHVTFFSASARVEHETRKENGMLNDMVDANKSRTDTIIHLQLTGTKRVTGHLFGYWDFH